MTPEDHGPNVVRLVHIGGVFQNAVDPAADRDAGLGHQAAVALAFKLPFQPVEIFFPDAGPVRPRTRGEAVVARQRVAEDAEVRCALHVVMAAEDVRAAARHAHVAQRKLKHAVGAGVVVAVGVLRAAHAPDHGARPVVRHGPRHAAQLRARRAGHALHLFGVPFRDFLADLVHAPDAGADKLLVLPPVVEDVPEDAPDQRDVGAGPEPHIFVGMGRRAGEARIADDQRGVVFFLGLQHVQQRDGMRLRRVAADDEDGLGIVDVVVGVGHGAVAPCVRNARNGGGVADTRLMVDVVRPPVAREFAEQIGLLVIVLGRAEPVDAVRAAFFPDLHHAVADLVDRVVPAHPGPFPVNELHRVFQAPLAMGVLAHRSALGAMGAEVERTVPARLLPHPDAVGDFGHDGAADRAVGANGFYGFDLAVDGGGGLGLGHGPPDRADGCQPADGEARAAQKRAAVDGFFGDLCEGRTGTGAFRDPVGLSSQHCFSPL